LGLIEQHDVQRVEQAIDAARLPVRIAGLSRAAAVEAMRGDKKTERGTIRFVVLERIGRALQRPVPEEKLLETLDAGGYV
jgi:3-dehydroquinate synthase